jgi:nitrous oxide reductase
MRPTRRELLQTTALLGVAGAAMAAGVGTEPGHPAAEGLVPHSLRKGGGLVDATGGWLV